MVKYVFICTAILILHIIYLGEPKNSENYGEFTLKLSEVEICKGPKRNDCSNNTAMIINGTILQLYIDVKQNVIPNRGKIMIMLNGQPLVRLQMKKPCDHIFMKSLFQQLLNVTQDCVFKKGIYNLSVDLENLVQKYYGGMFFYGNITFKSILYNDVCNFFCITEEVTISPKKSTGLH